MEVRVRPKDNYLQQASFAQLHALTTHWKSDLEFQQFELRFFLNLMNGYFIWLKQDESALQIDHLADRIRESVAGVTHLQHLVDRHLRHLEELMENAFSHDERLFREEHTQLEDDLAACTKALRELKTMIIQHARDVEDQEVIPLTK
jgi:hypothetical protein